MTTAFILWFVIHSGSGQGATTTSMTGLFKTEAGCYAAARALANSNDGKTTTYACTENK